MEEYNFKCLNILLIGQLIAKIKLLQTNKNIKQRNLDYDLTYLILFVEINIKINYYQHYDNVMMMLYLEKVWHYINIT